MASSNRHWPSMFKSKPCNNHQHHHQWQHHQHDLNSPLISSTNCHRSPYSSAVLGCEERSPEPKPRWNPKPEQIRILEAIFNSGMVNPPRDEIRKIRGQLQEYGQVGDANVFYWFQNRKSRSKHKQRNQISSSKSQLNTTSPAIPAATSSPISSTENVAAAAAVVSSPDVPTIGGGPSVFYEPLMAPFEPFLFPVSTGTTDVTRTRTQGFGFSHEMNDAGLVHVTEDPRAMINCSGILMNERQMIMGEKKRVDNNIINDDEKLKLHQLMSYNSFSATHLVASTTASSVVTAAAAVTAPSSFNHILGIEHQLVPPVGRYTVFINDVAFEVSMAPLNVREAFGHDAVLFHSSGQPVLTDEWGVTLQPLQHGCLYYLLRALLS